MAKKHGKDGVVQISDNDVLEVSNWSLSESSNQVESSAMGDSYTTNLGGIKSQSGSIECNFDEDDSTGQALMDSGQTVAIKLFVEADQTGATYFGGNALITEKEVSTPKDGVITASFSYVNADSSGITEQTVV